MPRSNSTTVTTCVALLLAMAMTAAPPAAYGQFFSQPTLGAPARSYAKPGVDASPDAYYTGTIMQDAKNYQDEHRAEDDYGNHGALATESAKTDWGCGPFNLRCVCSWGYISADAIAWNRSQLAKNTITMNSTDTTVLSDASNVSNKYEVLPRVTAGYVFSNGVIFEASGFYKDDFNDRSDTFAQNDLDVTVFGTGTGFAGSTLDNADYVRVSTRLMLHNAEFNVVQTSRFFNFLGGFRWTELNDLAVISVFNDNNFSQITLDARNMLWGTQGGLRMNWESGQHGIEAQIKGGVYLCNSKVFTNTLNTGYTGFNNIQRSMQGHQYAFMGDAQIMYFYRPVNALRLQVGYSAMLITQLALSTEQITNNALTGLQINASNQIFFQGPFAGAEFRW